MKKFVIISAVLLLLAAGAFGFSLYHYMQVTDVLGSKAPAATEAPTEAAEPGVAEVTTEEETIAVAENVTDIFAANADKAATYVANLSTEQMVGQLIMGICDDSSSAATNINQYSLSGMLFESSNFSGMSQEEVSTTLAAASDNVTIAPILAAMEEGGYHTTISGLDAFSDYSFNSPRTTFANGGLQAAEKAEDNRITMLKSAGFNLNLAPSVDLAVSSDQMMYSRSVSEDVDTASAYAEYAAKFDQAKGVSIALKHFPGYGTILDDDDTGVGAVVDKRDAASIRENDYTPFKKGVEAGAHFVMMSNVVVQNLDATHTAALSASIHNELRTTVGFTGVIITDVLDERDFSSYADGNKPAVQAVLAGNDIVLVRDYATAYSDILAAVNAGTISETQLKDACTRVIAYKYTAGIIK